MADVDMATPGAEERRPLGWLLSYQAHRDPGRAAVTFEGVTITRGELDKAANRMARALAELGVQQDDIIPMVLPNNPAHHVFAFALWKLGATPLPISNKLPGGELLAIVDLVKPRLVIGPAAGALEGFTCLSAAFAPDPSLSDTPLPEKVAKHWKCITSGGSTGRPKVIVDGAPSVASHLNQLPMLKMVSEDVLLHPGPMYHNAFFAQSNWSLCAGAHIIEMPRFDALEWLRLVERHKVRWAYLVPATMHRIWSVPQAERDRFDLSSLEVAIHMAAPCPPWLKAAWIDWLGPDRIWEIYGATEPVGSCTISGSEWLEHRGSVGKPKTVRVLDEEGQDLPVGEVGELYFPTPESRNFAYSYVGADRRIRDGWETLGDMGSVDADGYLYIADRRTDMIISGGVNIYPAEIEAALDAHPAVSSSVVVGLPDRVMGRLSHAIVNLQPGAPEPSASELMSFLAERLVRYKLPYTYEVSPDPLRDEAGKVRRSILRQEREALIEAGGAFKSLRAGGRVTQRA
jgi:bile acid-coenzyme A ligase